MGSALQGEFGLAGRVELARLHVENGSPGTAPRWKLRPSGGQRAELGRMPGRASKPLQSPAVSAPPNAGRCRAAGL